MKNSSLSLLACLLCLTFASCSKKVNIKPNTLPPATQTGANTFGTDINGKVFVPAPCLGCIGNGSGLRASYALNKFSIDAEYNDANLSNYISIYMGTLNGKGNYPIGYNRGNSSDTYCSVSISNANEGSNYLNDAGHVGTITITRFDTTKRIISGTFNFTAVNNQAMDSVAIVNNGRFDITY
jgi:hypothetical protein